MLNTTGSLQEGEMGMYLTAFEPNYKRQGEKKKRAERSFTRDRKAKELNLKQKNKNRMSSVSLSQWVCRAGEHRQD